MVEFYAATPADPGDYQIGEKININGNGTPLRYMYNPTLDGALARLLVHQRPSNVDVHYSSGVRPTTSSSTCAEGTGATSYGTSPVCGSAPAVTGIGRAKAEKIWYRALDVYFTSNTRYVNTTHPGQHRPRLHPDRGHRPVRHLLTEYKAVQAAWTAVNVAGSDAACPDRQRLLARRSPRRRARSTPAARVTTTVATDADQRQPRRPSPCPRPACPPARPRRSARPRSPRAPRPP